MPNEDLGPEMYSESVPVLAGRMHISATSQSLNISAVCVTLAQEEDSQVGVLEMTAFISRVDVNGVIDITYIC